MMQDAILYPIPKQAQGPGAGQLVCARYCTTA